MEPEGESGLDFLEASCKQSQEGFRQDGVGLDLCFRMTPVPAGGRMD